MRCLAVLAAVALMLVPAAISSSRSWPPSVPATARQCQWLGGTLGLETRFARGDCWFRASTGWVRIGRANR